jgi:hypothetical protein
MQNLVIATPMQNPVEQGILTEPIETFEQKMVRL